MCLPESIPRDIAVEVLLTGHPLPAERAHQLGVREGAHAFAEKRSPPWEGR
ncbi:hypothetical protein ACFVTC_00240 [Streptomyces sp. NPDC057950]|uniref:hypothetical protein n=1 Tax=Streptomyces sp. NPDC057950 TaxID=3346288 RepID=UPI0036E9E0B2